MNDETESPGGNRLPVLASEIRQAHADVQEAAKTAAQRAIDAGHALVEAKGLVQHGQWLPWLKENCALAERTAQLYMKLARSGAESATVAALGLKAAAQTLHLQYSDFFTDPFADGDETERRDWWLFGLFLVKHTNMHPAGVCEHIYWITRQGYEAPDVWLREGPARMNAFGCKMSEGLLGEWQTFRTKHDGRAAEDIVEELERLAAEAPALEVAGKRGKKRRARKKAA